VELLQQPYLTLFFNKDQLVLKVRKVFREFKVTLEPQRLLQ
jgi:hypothetical protein